MFASGLNDIAGCFAAFCISFAIFLFFNNICSLSSSSYPREISLAVLFTGGVFGVVGDGIGIECWFWEAAEGAGGGCKGTDGFTPFGTSAAGGAFFLGDADGPTGTLLLPSLDIPFNISLIF